MVAVFLVVLVVMWAPGATRSGVVFATSCNTGFLATNLIQVRYPGELKTYHTTHADTCLVFSQHLGWNVTVQEWGFDTAHGILHYSFADGVQG
jgi:hypothetical protein